MLVLILCSAPGARTVWAQSSQPVYTDALVNGWQNWSWATVNLSNTAPVQAGADSIAVSAGPWEALYLHHDAIDSSLFTNLVFWINGGASGGQLLQVQAELSGNPQVVVTLPALGANTWRQVSIPLASLGAQGKPDFDGFWIRNYSAVAQPQFYLDSISLTAIPPPSVVNVTVDAAQVLRTLDARHFGLNAAVWDGVFDTVTTKNLLSAMGNQALRFPGGSLSDDYHWATNTTGNNTWQWPTPFSAFADVAKALGSQVFITANYGSGTSAEAANWVRSSNVTNRYGFKYWEIGNEVYGLWETDNNTRPHDPYTYAQRFAQYLSQMKAVDPAIKVGAVAVPGEDSYANYNDHPALNPATGVTHYGWTPVMLATLKSLGVTPDFLSYHRYPQNSGGEYDLGLLLSSGTWATDAADLRRQLNDYLGAATAARVELLATENNSVSSDPGKQTTSLVNGLYMADSICAAMRTEFNAFLWWDLRDGPQTGNNNSAALYGWRNYGDYGVVDSANPPGPADAYPAYYVGKLLKYFARGGDQLIAASSGYPLLSVCAAKRKDGTLGLLLINKSASTAFDGSITLNHAMPAATGNRYSYGMPQDEAARTGVGSADIAAATLTGIGPNFPLSLPPYSATVLTFANRTPTPTSTPRVTPTATPRPTATAKPSATPTRTARPTATPTSTPVAGPIITSLPEVIRVGDVFTIKGRGFDASSVVNFFVATGSGPQNVGPIIPVAPLSATNLDVPLAASITQGEGVAAVVVVNQDQEFAQSNTMLSLLQGNPAKGLPSLTGINSTAIAWDSIDPGFALANIETVVAQGTSVKITGTGFDTTNGVAVDIFCACSGGKVGPFFIPGTAGAGVTATSIVLPIPGSGAYSPVTGPGSFQVSNAGATKSYGKKSAAVAAVIGARVHVTSVSRSGSMITVTGSGFALQPPGLTLPITVINFFNQGATPFNLGGLNVKGGANIPLTILSSTKLTFTLPVKAVPGAAYVQVLNSPFVPFSSSDNDSGGALVIH